jgi:hypothetical protein
MMLVSLQVWMHRSASPHLGGQALVGVLDEKVVQEGLELGGEATGRCGGGEGDGVSTGFAAQRRGMDAD